MSKENYKPYAVIAFVKPKQTVDKDGLITKFKGRSYKGIVFETSQEKAKEKTFELLIDSFKDNKTVNVNREIITIKSCKLHYDFLVPPKQD